MDQALEVSRATSIEFLGPWVMGTLSLVSADAERSKRAMTEAEELLAGDCVGHNYIAFYRLAMEVNLRLEDWDEVERFAEAEQRSVMSALPALETALTEARNRSSAHGLARSAAANGVPR